MAEETINEVRGATSGLAPPMLLDVAYIEALPRDHLTKMEDNEVGRCEQKRNHLNVQQAQVQEEERRIPSPDSTQQSLVAVEASAHSGRMDSTEEMMETCSRVNQASSINSSRRSSVSQSLVESNLRQRVTGNIVSCPTYNWHQPDFST